MENYPYSVWLAKLGQVPVNRKWWAIKKNKKILMERN